MPLGTAPPVTAPAPCTSCAMAALVPSAHSAATIAARERDPLIAIVVSPCSMSWLSGHRHPTAPAAPQRGGLVDSHQRQQVAGAGSRVTEATRIAGITPEWNMGDNEALRFDSIGARRRAWARAAVAVWAFSAVVGAWGQATSNPNLNAQQLVAARNNDLPSVQRALADGAAPDSRNRLGKTALRMACEKGQAPLAAAMLRAGADVNLASLEGVTPLMAASYGGHAAIAGELLRAGARTDGSDRMHKSAWIYAAAQGHAEVVTLLLDAGVAVDAAGEHQLTALMWAAGQGHTDVVRLLLQRGARPDLRDDRGLSALEIARQTGHDDAALLLQAR